MSKNSNIAPELGSVPNSSRQSYLEVIKTESEQPEGIDPIATELINEFPKPNRIKSVNQSDVFRAIIEGIIPADINDFHPSEISRGAIKPRAMESYIIDEINRVSLLSNLGICSKNETIFVYNGAYWEAPEKQVLRDFLHQCGVSAGVTDRLSKHYKNKEALHKNLLENGTLKTPESDPSKVLINLQNGTLEIQGGKATLREFRQSDFLTYQLPYRYDPTATAPMWGKFLNEVIEVDKQAVLQEYFGSAFIRGNSLKLEKALALHGTGANGKSVVFEVMQAVFGGSVNVTNYTPSDLTQDSKSEYYRANIIGKLLNYSSEAGNEIKADIFKSIISREPISARKPYGEAYQSNDLPRIVFNTNELPTEVEYSNAYFRRLILIPFEKVIPIESQDLELAIKIIESELSGVLNWLIDGLNRLIANNGKFTECESVKQSLDRYRSESDSVLSFIKAYGYEPDPNGRIYYKDFRAQYVQFCNENGFKPIGTPKMANRLRAYQMPTYQAHSRVTFISAKVTDAND